MLTLIEKNQISTLRKVSNSLTDDYETLVSLADIKPGSRGPNLTNVIKAMDKVWSTRENDEKWMLEDQGYRAARYIPTDDHFRLSKPLQFKANPNSYEYGSGLYVIIGQPGSGKSTFTHELSFNGKNIINRSEASASPLMTYEKVYLPVVNYMLTKYGYAIIDSFKSNLITDSSNLGKGGLSKGPLAVLENLNQVMHQVNGTLFIVVNPLEIDESIINSWLSYVYSTVSGVIYLRRDGNDFVKLLSARSYGKRPGTLKREFISDKGSLPFDSVIQDGSIFGVDAIRSQLRFGELTNSAEVVHDNAVAKTFESLIYNKEDA